MHIQHSCYLCKGKKFKKRKGTVRDNPDLKVIECISCGLVFLSSFSHIHHGFYESGKMHSGEIDIDIDAWLKETEWDDSRRFYSHRRLIENKSVLDFGCGIGGFLLLAKSVVSRAVGIEPETRLRPYFQEKQINVFSDINELSENFDIITLFHVLEHLADPVSILIKLQKKLNKGGYLIVEVPNANDALLTLYQSDPFSKFTYWSCHLFLFTGDNLSMLAKKAGLKVNYIKQIQRYPLSNHLYWLAKGKPGGHKEWNFLDSEELHKAYEKQLASIGVCDTILGSFSK
jgi:2-polyprenyl-3-methyl-5-hydroxy-6-metoxy-1,4-benzoquinol methylase